MLSSQIMHHLESNDIIYTTQFGFRNKHSCESQLLITIDDFAKALNSKKQVYIGILDFSNMFDRVPHTRLAKKLDFYGINGETLSWIQSFLSNRQQNVVINDVCSSSCVVTSRVPQGSVLCPNLVLLYIDDLTKSIIKQC